MEPRRHRGAAQDGGTPSGAFVADEMEHVVQNTAKLSAEDRRAMAEYLKTLPARPGRRPAGSN